MERSSLFFVVHFDFQRIENIDDSFLPIWNKLLKKMRSCPSNSFVVQCFLTQGFASNAT